MSNTGKKSKKNYLLIVLILLLVGISVGYAAFAQNLYIVGTATASGKFALRFASASNFSSADSSNDGTTGTISLNDTADTLTISADLAQPDSKAVFNAFVENVGSIGAELSSITITNTQTNTSKEISVSGESTVTYDDFTVKCDIPSSLENIAGNTIASDPVVITIIWNSKTPASNQNSTVPNLTFNITLNYTQNSSGTTGLYNSVS